MAHVLRWSAVVALIIPQLILFTTPAAAQEGEKKITIDQVPTPVKQAILKAVGDGRLVDIGEFAQEGEKVYEIEMVVDGKEFDVLFSSTGKVLRKTFEGLKPGGRPEEKKPGTAGGAFQDSFDLENRDLSSRGRNKYFILEPGYQLVLEGKEGEHTVRLAVTVLDETKKIGGIETRVMEERESVDGELVEISRNFLAICKRTRSVFYFGEEVDIYKGGKVIAHEGAWLHGTNKARAGMLMPGEPILGARYYQEVAPEVAMDRATIVDLTTTLTTPAGEFKGCLKVQEENPLDKEKEFKIHAPGIGLIQDEDLLLVKYGDMNKPSSPGEERERKISVQPSELPPLIRKAIKAAFPAGTVLRIQKEVEGEDPGQYDVDIRAGGKEYEVEISPAGEVIEIKEKGTDEEA
jgi:hypothetical protein